MKKKSRINDLTTVGFALFAMFFGAGNLIFPPYLGVISGPLWWLSFAMFFLADFGLGLVAVIGMIRLDGRVDLAMEPLGRIPAVALATTIIVCIGPAIAIPRTAATTYELGLLPLFGMESGKLSLAVFSVIFFSAALALSIQPGRVIDVIGKFLTPILLAALLVLISKGVLFPEAPVGETLTDSPVRDGIYNGYQTLDMVGSVFLSTMLLNAFRRKGYEGTGTISKMALRSAILSAALLFLVYGGLAYLGAGTGSLFSAQVMDGSLNQAGLTVRITEAVLGRGGIAVLAIVVSSACMTTAVGLISAASQYFEKLLKGKVSYRKIVVIICIAAAGICNLGLSQIISVALPALMLLYPVTILMILTIFLREKVKSVIPYRLAAAVTFLMSFLDMMGSTFGVKAFARFTAAMPFSSYGLCWFVPAAAAFAAGMAASFLIKDGKIL